LPIPMIMGIISRANTTNPFHVGAPKGHQRVTTTGKLFNASEDTVD
jgi:hypothetical protein